MRPLTSWLLTAATVLLTVGAFACGNSQSPASPSAPSTTGGSSSANGTLTIRLTDSPFSDANALLVTFSEVSVHRADPGAWIPLSFPTGVASRTCNLKLLQGGATDLLGTAQALTVGAKYTQIRLTVESAFLYFSPNSGSIGGVCVSGITPPTGGVPVKIPSGEVKLNHEFTVSGTGTMILLDFDGEQSVHQTGGGNGNGKGNPGYIMSPVIRVVSVT